MMTRRAADVPGPGASLHHDGGGIAGGSLAMAGIAAMTTCGGGASAGDDGASAGDSAASTASIAKTGESAARCFSAKLPL